MSINDIYVYQGHTSQDINITDISDISDISNGNILFEKSRIQIPSGYRFITFHFNDEYTTANKSGPFILYGLKDISAEDIESLFVNLEGECIYSSATEEIICDNERSKNILKFKIKMFKSFIVHYIDFLINNYEESKTKDIDPIYAQKYVINNAEQLLSFITDIFKINKAEIIKIFDVSDYDTIEPSIKKEIKKVISNNPQYYLNLLYLEKFINKKDLLEKILFNIFFSLIKDDETISLIKTSGTRLAWGSSGTHHRYLNIKDSLSGISINIINDFLKSINIEIRTYEENTLTPILIFYDYLTFKHKSEYHNYIYGFYRLDEYKQKLELPFAKFNSYKLRSKETGLSDYSLEHNIPQELRLESNQFINNLEEFYISIKQNVINTHFINLDKDLENLHDFLDNITQIKILNHDELCIYLKEINENININPSIEYIEQLDNILTPIIQAKLVLIYNEYHELIPSLQDYVLNYYKLFYYIILLKINDNIPPKVILELFSKGKINLEVNKILFPRLNIMNYLIDIIDPLLNKLNDAMKDTDTYFAKINSMNFFKFLQKGTYIITSCGNFTEKLRDLYHRPPILLNADSQRIFENEQDKIQKILKRYRLSSVEEMNLKQINDATFISNREKIKQYEKTISEIPEIKQFQDEFNTRTTHYDIYWRKKYLKYKKKYQSLKKN
jgi:hypothetical protein